MNSVTVGAVLTGHAVPFGPQGEPSAMAKSHRDGPVAVTWLGLADDEQADLNVHGGPDKAVHHYPHDHYDWWKGGLPGHPLLGRAGAFGENLSTTGLTEDQVCIGDRWRLGSALVEVSQGRQPCWKLNHRFGDKQVMAMVVKSGRSGWYWRVIEEGTVEAGDTLTLVDQPHPRWSVSRVFGLLVRGDSRSDASAFADLARLEPLSASWRQRAAQLARG